jgi:hypothetical protein
MSPAAGAVLDHLHHRVEREDEARVADADQEAVDDGQVSGRRISMVDPCPSSL